MTTHEAAARLGITARSVARLIRANLLAADWDAYARRYTIDSAEVERYERERRAQGRPMKGTGDDS